MSPLRSRLRCGFQLITCAPSSWLCFTSGFKKTSRGLSHVDFIDNFSTKFRILRHDNRDSDPTFVYCFLQKAFVWTLNEKNIQHVFGWVEESINRIQAKRISIQITHVIYNRVVNWTLCEIMAQQNALPRIYGKQVLWIAWVERSLRVVKQ